MHKWLILILCLSSISTRGFAQYMERTFQDTRVINTQSVETVAQYRLDFRVGHRFGDIAGPFGGWITFYGLEDASDIFIGFDYGITDHATVGIGRTKGSGPLRQLLHGNVKYRILTQNEGTPVSVTAYGLASITTMSKSNDATAINYFATVKHRLSYHGELLIARHFTPGFSLQINAGWTHRNIVSFGDQNDIWSVGLASRLKVSKSLAILLDAAYPISSLRTSENDYYMPLGVGIEIETGGHVFQVNLTNATGIAETDFIPYTRKSWRKGEFRLGFTISRLFKIL